MPDGPVHSWFSLTYSSYAVLSRLAMQEMPEDWQRRFVDWMHEVEAADLGSKAKYLVLRRGRRGRFVDDPWANYRRGTVADAKRQEEELG